MTSHPRRSPTPRFKTIFPGGFDEKFGHCSSISQHSGSSRSGHHFTFEPEQLWDSLIERNNPDTPLESIIVKAAWYGKKTKSSQHEFIAIKVEDIKVSGLTDYLILDRNVEANQGNSRRASLVSSQTADAKDAFKVSYDGYIEKLLEECQLMPYMFLEKLSFQTDHPLRLYELVILSHVVSQRHPKYQLIDSSCYLFAGVIWECMRLMRPSAIYDDTLASERGRCNWLRYTPSDSGILSTYRLIQIQILAVEKDFKEYGNVRSVG